MYQKTYYATHPESIYGATNDDLRELYLVEELFAGGEIRLNYTHFERIVVGGTMSSGAKISKLKAVKLRRGRVSAVGFGSH